MHSVDRPANPTVSVLVPSYNYGRLVGRCIEGVLRQSFSDFELVISDDASTDDSDAVIRSFRDPRIVYERQSRNLGMVPNWRACVALSRAPLLLLIGADDLLEQDMLARSVPVLQSDPEIAFCHTAANFYNSTSGRVVGSTGCFTRSFVRPGVDLVEGFLLGKRVVNSSAVFRRACFEELGGWSDRYRNCMDLELWFRMLLRWKVAYVGRPLVRFHAHSVSPSWTIMQALEDVQFVAHMFELLPPEMQHLRAHESMLVERARRGWLSTLRQLPQSAERDRALVELAGGLERESGSRAQRPAWVHSLSPRVRALLAKLPDEARFLLGDLADRLR